MFLLSCMGTCLCFVKLTSAEVNLPIEQSNSVELQAPQDPTQQSLSSPSTEKAEQKSEAEEGKPIMPGHS